MKRKKTRKKCPFLGKCGASRIKEIKGERGFIEQYCHSKDKKRNWENCYHFKLRNGHKVSKKARKNT